MDNIEGYKTIDGNYSRHAVGYCTYHKGFLTSNQMRVHKCKRKYGGVCGRLQDIHGRYEMANMQSSLDKMVDRLIKIDSNLSRILKELQKISRSVDTREEGKTLSDNSVKLVLYKDEIDREESI